MDDSYADRRLPSLLDRLFDTSEGPGRLHTESSWSAAKAEGRHALGSSMREATQLVVQDLEALLNARAMPADSNVYHYPFVARSVVNFGVRDFRGSGIVNSTPDDMEREVTRAIDIFEPRVVPGTLKVSHTTTKDAQSIHAVGLEVSAQICPLPIPEPLLVRTQVDLTTGKVDVRQETSYG